MKMKKITSAALALGLALGLAGCGGNQAAGGSDLEYIKEKGTMVIGYTVYEPMNYTDENGVFTGFDTELATAVCQKLGVEPEFVEINWDTKIAELDGKSIDCIWNGMTLTDDILENTACTEPYVKNAQVVVMKADALILPPPTSPARPSWRRAAAPGSPPWRKTPISPRRSSSPRPCRPTA